MQQPRPVSFRFRKPSTQISYNNLEIVWRDRLR